VVVPYLTDGYRVTILQDRVVADLDAWRRVPWCALLGASVQDRVAFPPSPFGNEYGAGGRRDLSIGDILLDYPYLWVLDAADFELHPPVIAAVDCRTGSLVGLPFMEAPRPLSRAEIQEWVLPKAAACNPAPLLAKHDFWAARAVMPDIVDLLTNQQITPTLPLPGMGLDTFDAAVLALAPSWEGTAATLLDAAALLLSDESEHPAAPAQCWVRSLRSR
jgi:hypothetical protein